MRITQVQAMRLTTPPESDAARAQREALTRRPGWNRQQSIDNPARKYAFARRDSTWTGPRPAAWETVACKVTAEDGTWGLGLTSYGRPVAAIIDDQFAPLLTGQPALATERLWDMMVRAAKAYGTTSLTSYAVSAVDLALWDLKGKLLRQPVYALLGGPAHDELVCYATGNDTDWYVELGFEANKLAHLWGLTERLEGLEATEQQVATARETLGARRELMLDCWQSFDVDYTVRLAERLRPYRMRWIEECLPAEDLDAHVALRQRLPWMTLTAGEHWYAPQTFMFACRHQVVDILQPDIQWCGGVTGCVKIAHMAESAGLSVMLHAGANTAYGQHFSYALPAVAWTEMFMASDPGVPLETAMGAPRGYMNLPGTPVPVNGRLRPSDAPGFGLEVPDTWLTPFFSP